MRTFLADTARTLYGIYGDEVSSLNIIIPNTRTRVFFSRELAGVIGKPLWEPSFTTVDAVMERYAGIVRGDELRLLVDLYQVWNTFSETEFDRFFSWGTTLLSDFDSVDKYMLDPVAFFANVNDYKVLSQDHSYFNEQQREALNRFWEGFWTSDPLTESRNDFLSLWSVMADVYHTFKANLLDNGYGYSGMVHRRAVENIKAGNYPADGAKYAVVGFNALTACEKKLFLHLKNNNDCLFFWDYDRYYTDDRGHEAGVFIRENIELLGKTADDGPGNGLGEAKKITIVEAHSDLVQARYVADYLEQTTQGDAPAVETAVVLADEDLLLPVLGSVPPGVPTVNVTMGYPFRNTLVYTFIERLMQLQDRAKLVADRWTLHLEDASGLLRHPLYPGAGGMTIAGSLHSGKTVRVPVEDIIALGGNATIFRSFEAGGWRETGGYVLEALRALRFPEVADENQGKDTSPAREIEIQAAGSAIEGLNKLLNSLEHYDIPFSYVVFRSIVRKHLQRITIPFEGEPLSGIQVMGLLETRNLDFRNVLLLSASDDRLPGNSEGESMIPYALRFAWGLPTRERKDAVYAYYFYRLLQRAENVHIAYKAHSDERGPGEPSRYVRQLNFEFPQPVSVVKPAVNVAFQERRAITIEKTDEVMSRLELFRKPGGKSLSPTALTNYIVCPLKFYYISVAGLRSESVITGQVDAPAFGTLFHKAAEFIYRPLLNSEDPQDALRSLPATGKIGQYVDMAVFSEYFGGKTVPHDRWQGNLLLVRDIIVKYLEKCLLPFDVRQPPFRIGSLEAPLEGVFTCTDDAGERFTVNLTGKADRIDLLEDGTARIVDYKTGGGLTAFRGIDSLFGREFDKLNNAVFQTLIYSMLLSRSYNGRVRPAAYFLRQMFSKDYEPHLVDRERDDVIYSYGQVADQFEGQLSQLLRSLFDQSEPFVQCAETKACVYCEFNILCRRV